MSIHKYKLKDGFGYKAVVQVSPTKQISKKFHRHYDAEVWEQEQKAKLRNDPMALINEKRMTIAELSDYWMEHYAKVHKEGSSVARDKQILKNQVLPFFGTKALSDLTPRVTELWLETLKQDRRLAPKTCNNCLTLIRKMLNDAVRWQFIRFNPISAVRPFKVEQQDFDFWSRDECERFLYHAATMLPNAMPVFVAALTTGMRRGELEALKWDAIDLDRRQLTVKRTFCDRTKVVKETTKSKMIRRIPINPTLFSILAEMKLRKTSDFVFRGFGFHNAGNVIKKIATVADVRTIRFHDLRHTFASQFMMAGGKIYDLQKILGHSTVQMTEKYSHLSPEHLAGKTDIINFVSIRDNQRKVVNLPIRSAN